jgi:hypothetical protein
MYFILNLEVISKIKTNPERSDNLEATSSTWKSKDLIQAFNREKTKGAVPWRSHPKDGR